MESIIDLNNNYYLEIVNNINDLPTDVIDVEKLNLSSINKNRKLLLKVDFNNFDKMQYKKILKKLLFIKQIILKRKI